MNQFTSTLLRAAVAATIASSLPAHALTFEGAATAGASTVTDYSALGLMSFDLDLRDFTPVALDFRIEAADLSAPIAFSALVRNLSGRGLGRLEFMLSSGSFNSVGTVTRFFGGTTSASPAGGASVTLLLSSPEFFDLEIGNALGSTPAAAQWTLSQTGFQAGDRFTLTVASAVPEPEAFALWLAGLGLVGWLARRRSF